ncbi:Rv3235 family protein [Streptacidiphilus neutrinimicus]|uniref:Rv3235 family protein n=1 Tax=Streptacidiphilus neutrinimicus TaxID=105420 RepID=UPI0005A75DF8|nr:Rv3235 family protein [Streptacidiphilus neutrinimicus]
MTTHTGNVRIGRLHGVGARRRPTPCTTSQNPLARAYAQRLLEVLTGMRPQEQLLAFATEDVYDRVRTLRALGCLRADGSRPVLQRVFDSAPRQDALEVTALVRVGARTETLAFRLECRALRRSQNITWRFTALESRW